jgi:hypothetical protein
MTSIEKYKTPGALATTNQFDADLRMAEALCMSELMPDAYRGSIPNTLIAIDVARRIGSSILQVCQNLHIIHGKPSWSASFLIGTVNASGKFTRLKPQFVGDGPQRGCRMIATDLADGMQCIGTLFTYQMAVDEGYVSRKGSKWKTFGEQMLQYRAAALWVRVFAPEVSLGMQTSDEADDIGAFAVSSSAPVNARRGTRGSAAVTADAERATKRIEAAQWADSGAVQARAQAAASAASQQLSDGMLGGQTWGQQAMQDAQGGLGPVEPVQVRARSLGDELAAAAAARESARAAARASVRAREPGDDDEPIEGAPAD